MAITGRHASLESQFICDRAGRRYRLHHAINGQRSHFLVYERETLVGEAKCVRESPERMALGDIAIANEAIPTPINGLMRNLRQLPGFQHSPVSYRGRGLGTALLKHLIEYTREVGAIELCGEVFQQDIENSPNLLNWYQRLGFERQCPSQHQSPSKPIAQDVVAIICFEMVRPNRLDQQKFQPSPSSND